MKNTDLVINNIVIALLIVCILYPLAIMYCCAIKDIEYGVDSISPYRNKYTNVGNDIVCIKCHEWVINGKVGKKK